MNSRFSQNVPVQPTLQVQAPLMWSHDASFSHWQRCQQPSPKKPAGHSGIERKGRALKIIKIQFNVQCLMVLVDLGNKH